MKAAKLPGFEKFKFSDRKPDDTRTAVSPPAINFVRGTASRSTCPPTSSLSTGRPSVCRDSRRRPILPLTGRMTTRVLTLTHLPLDSFSIRELDCCRKPSSTAESGLCSVAGVASTPTITSASRVSLFSDSSGSQSSSSSTSSQPSPRSLCSPLDRCVTPSHWAKSAHRLSTSSQSSWEDQTDQTDGPESGADCVVWTRPTK